MKCDTCGKDKAINATGWYVLFVGSMPDKPYTEARCPKCLKSKSVQLRDINKRRQGK